MTTIYIAGPMTRVPQFNFPLFDAVAADLRKRGHIVVSPAEQDSPQIRALALASPDGVFTPEMKSAETMGEILGRDVRIVIDDCTHVALLPGWRQSTGARLEVCVALLHGKEFYEVEGFVGTWGLYSRSRQLILEAFREAVI